MPQSSHTGVRRRTLNPHQPDTGQAPGAPYSDKIQMRPADALQPYARNARRHDDKQVAQLAASIDRFGFINPILMDAQGQVIAGHGRLLAAQRLEITHVPTLEIDHLSEAEIKAYRLADNRIAELAGWDDDLLALELGELSQLDVEFDLEITGFDTAAIDLLLDPGPSSEETDPLDDIPDLDTARQPVSHLGDLWHLGRHRLLCGNALDLDAHRRLLDTDRVRVVFTDPPFNVPIEGHVSGLGAVRHPEFVMGAGEMSEPEFIEFLSTALAHMTAHCIDGAILFLMMDWRHGYELMTAARRTHLAFKNLCVWTKTNAGMGSFYRSQHELVFVFKQGAAPHTNTFGLGDTGRYRTNVWRYAGVNSFGSDRLEQLAMHPTVKPVAMVADAIKDCSRRGEIVLDPFAGSGTTLMAAEKTARIARCLELDPRYVDVAVRRWESQTGQSALHAGSGQPFTEIAAERAEQTADLADA